MTMSKIDAVLGDPQRLELTLDVIMDQVFPPGEERNTERLDPRWFDDDEPRYGPMVRPYVPGSDPEGEESAGYVHPCGLNSQAMLLMDDLYERVDLNWVIVEDRLPNEREQHEEAAYPGENEEFVGYMRAYGVYAGPRGIDGEWVVAEQGWLAEHSQP